MNVVSLLPSATEIVHGLGHSNWLTGRSHECDFPTNIDTVPIVTYATIDTTASSRSIDIAVKKRLSQSLSLYGIEKERLRAAEPDVIITQTQCDVCAVSLRDVQAFLKDDLDINAELVVLEPHRLEDIWTDIHRVSKALHQPNDGVGLVDQLKKRLDAIARESHALEPPSVAMIEWIDPLMAAGNWIPELVKTAGGTNLFGKTGYHSGWLEWETLKEADPDVIVVAPCGFDLQRTLQEIETLERLEGWPQLRAVRNHRVYAVDGNAFLNRPGPRLVESAEILAEILHPKVFSFGHSNQDWLPVSPNI